MEIGGDLDREVPGGDYRVFAFIEKELPRDCRILFGAAGNPGFLCKRPYHADPILENETLVGILADALCARAVARAAALKRRPPGEPFPVLVSSLRATAFVSVRLPPGARRLARRFWPGPLTLLLPAKEGLPPEIVGPGGTVDLARYGYGASRSTKPRRAR